MESAWNEGVVLVADIHFPALLNAHPPLLDPRRKRRGTKHGTMSRNLPSSLPYPFSLFLNTGCIFPGHSRCQESRASNVKGAADIC